MLNTIVMNVDGALTLEVCEALCSYATKVPSSGAILDLNCGEGRSTVIMANALTRKRKDAYVMAVDTHVRNPFTDAPYNEGTLLALVNNVRRFKESARVIPIVASADLAYQVVGKRCANFVVVQSPRTAQSSYHEDAFLAAIKAAKDALRKNGNIAICRPIPLEVSLFADILHKQFPAKSFKRVYDSTDLVVVEEGG